MPSDLLLNVALQSLAHLRTKRYEAALVELGIANEQRGAFKLDVSHQEPGDFSHTQPNP